MTDDRPLLTMHQVCERLNVHPRTIYRLMERRELRHVHIASALRFVPADVDEYMYREWTDKNGSEA